MKVSSHRESKQCRISIIKGLYSSFECSPLIMLFKFKLLLRFLWFNTAIDRSHSAKPVYPTPFCTNRCQEKSGHNMSIKLKEEKQ